MILNKAMRLVVVATALPARLLGVPLDEVLGEWHVIVNLLAGRLLGAWLGATWATRIASETLYRVIAALLVLIAVALAANHVGTISQLDLATGAQVVAGLVTGMGIGDRRRASGLEDGRPGGLLKAAKWSVRVGLALRAVRKPLGPGAHHLTSLLYLAGGLLFRYAWVGAGRGSARHHRVVARMARDRGPGA